MDGIVKILVICGFIFVDLKLMDGMINFLVICWYRTIKNNQFIIDGRINFTF